MVAGQYDIQNKKRGRKEAQGIFARNDVNEKRLYANNNSGYLITIVSTQSLWREDAMTFSPEVRKI